jgi:chemotaxis protein CheX
MAEQMSDQVYETVKNIWSMLLDMEITRSDQAISSLRSTANGATITSCIQLTGAWEGSILLFCTRQLAQKMAAVMFDVPQEEISSEDIEDAMGELGNITAGNLKLLFPDRCDISLPTVADGDDYRFMIPGSMVSSKLLLECECEPLQVTLLEKCSNQRAA